MNLRTELPTAENSSNFNAVADAATKAGTTLENLKAAVAGETGASAKYAAFAKAAKEQGFDILWGQSWGLAGPPDMDPALVKFWDDAIQKLVATDEWKATVKEMFLRSEVVPASKAKEHFVELHNQHLAVLKDLGLAK